MHPKQLRVVASLAAILLISAAALPSLAYENTVTVDGVEYESWFEFYTSEAFQARATRCGFVETEGADDPLRVPSDCSYSSTNPKSDYEPAVIWTIPVVVHILTTTGGTGNMTDAMVQSQIDILNEDYQALPGTNGAPGYDVKLQFELATEDPLGDPTTGITRTANNDWYNDNGTYYNTLAWDTNRYMNIYTNSAGGYLGYVPDLPQGGIVGSNSDRVVIYWASFGRNAPFSPYDLGRTATHEVGHYLGLYHPFDGGCGTSSCYTTGDRICDTNQESSPVFGCPGSSSSCGSQDPFHNYMDYSDDICMYEFTQEQTRRMRCTLQYYRPDLYSSNSLIGVAAETAPAAGLALAQAAPNPFNPHTTLGFSVGREGAVSLSIYDVLGRQVRTLVNGFRGTGEHSVAWDGLDESGLGVASGVYFTRLEAGGEVVTAKLVLTR